jgi:formylmethanofuran dehydrogenase subunit B
MTFERQPEVLISVGTPGVDHGGEIFRTDGVVSLPLAVLRNATRPSAANLLDRIDRALADRGNRP